MLLNSPLFVAKREQIFRINRMQRENIYLLGSSRQHDDNSIIFQVVGSTSKLYDVTLDFDTCMLSEFIDCNCPDSRSYADYAGVKCKHCCFVLLKVLKQQEYILGLNKITDEMKQNIQAIYDKLIFIPIKDNDDTINNIDWSKLDTTSECPICYDLLVPTDFKKDSPQSTEDIQGCKVCKNIVHIHCIKKWLRSGNNSCVYCRSPWK